MNNVSSAVSKASQASKRKGRWASKPEISQKITGKRPADLGAELRKLVKDGHIEKKDNASLWRPNGMVAGGIGAGMSATARASTSEAIRKIMM